MRTIPPWIPPHDTVDAVEAGTHWDAICLPQQTGLATVAILDTTTGPRPGPVIWDTRRDPRIYILIPVGTDPDLTGIPARHLTAGHHLAVPGPDLTTPPGIHWLIPPVGDQLTDPGILTAAIRRAVGASWAEYRLDGQQTRDVLVTHAQIHAQACVLCGQADRDLRSAGHVYTPALGGCGYPVVQCAVCLAGALT
ncbi:hypothetical protein ACWGB8_02155 [Kitasatospora sp. NPDC054939]